MYNDPSSGCQNEANIPAAIGIITDDLVPNIDNLFDLFACENIQLLYQLSIESGLCTNFFTGFYTIWVSQFVTSLFLFFLICFACVLYKYFDNQYWNSQVVPTNYDENDTGDYEAKHHQHHSDGNNEYESVGNHHQDHHDNHHYSSLEMTKLHETNEEDLL